MILSRQKESFLIPYSVFVIPYSIGLKAMAIQLITQNVNDFE